jgi:hypothetical protein
MGRDERGADVQGCKRNEDANPEMAPGKKVTGLSSRRIACAIPDSRC